MIFVTDFRGTNLSRGVEVVRHMVDALAPGDEEGRAVAISHGSR